MPLKKLEKYEDPQSPDRISKKYIKKKKLSQIYAEISVKVASIPIQVGPYLN